MPSKRKPPKGRRSSPVSPIGDEEEDGVEHDGELDEDDDHVIFLPGPQGSNYDSETVRVTVSTKGKPPKGLGSGDDEACAAYDSPFSISHEPSGAQEVLPIRACSPDHRGDDIELLIVPAVVFPWKSGDFPLFHPHNGDSVPTVLVEVTRPYDGLHCGDPGYPPRGVCPLGLVLVSGAGDEDDRMGGEVLDAHWMFLSGTEGHKAQGVIVTATLRAPKESPRRG